jgi:AAA domain
MRVLIASTDPTACTITAACVLQQQVNRKNKALAAVTASNAKYGNFKGSSSNGGKSNIQAGRDARALQGELDAAEQRAVRAILLDADVVVCSCIGAGNEAFVAATAQCSETGRSSIGFSTVLIDEATQVCTNCYAVVYLLYYVIR